MTTELQAILNATPVGGCRELKTKSVAFGTLCRNPDGTWNTTGVAGLPVPSLLGNPPSLLIRPFHQAGAVISLRQFTNNAFNHHR